MTRRNWMWLLMPTKQAILLARVYNRYGKTIEAAIEAFRQVVQKGNDEQKEEAQHTINPKSEGLAQWPMEITKTQPSIKVPDVEWIFLGKSTLVFQKWSFFLCLNNYWQFYNHGSFSLSTEIYTDNTILLSFFVINPLLIAVFCSWTKPIKNPRLPSVWIYYLFKCWHRAYLCIRVKQEANIDGAVISELGFVLLIRLAVWC